MLSQTAATAIETSDLWRVAAPARGWRFAAVAIGTFMTSLDGSSITAVLPVIGRSFGSPVATLEWVVTANLLVMSALLLAAGWLADRRGHTRVYVAGIAVFIAGSMLCAAAPSVAALIAVRTVQAAGAAMILATAAPLLMRMYGRSERGWALGLHVACNYVGLTLGPWLGGWLTDSLGWRAVFLFHLPLGVAALAMSARSLQFAEPMSPGRPFDAAGSVLFGGGLAAFLLAMNRVRHQTMTSEAVVLFAVTAVAASAFAAVERRARHPVLDLRRFARAPLAAAVSTLVFAYIGLQSVTFALPFYLIHTRGLTTAAAGALMSIRPAITAMVAPVSGRLCDRVGAVPIGAVGLAVLCAGCITVARLDGRSSVDHIVWGLSVMALGMGLLLAPAHTALFGAAHEPSQGIAASVMNTARTIGMAVGVGVGRVLLLGV